MAKQSPKQRRLPQIRRRARQLYQQHCAACHGATGDGKGIAAAYLYPKPRDFQAGRFRLVSTVNRTPSREDLLGVLRRGMPGSAMPPWNQLSDADLGLLVDEVRRLHAAGVRNQFVKVLVEDEELTDEEIQEPAVQKEIQARIEQRTMPGEITQVPPIAAPDAAAIARGKEIYVKQACNKCHGDTGRGDGQQQMVDDEGFPMTPRDFTAGIFKGGDDPASIYRRIAYGMPGTPMPSSQLKPEEIVDLCILCCRSPTNKREKTPCKNANKSRSPASRICPSTPTPGRVSHPRSCGWSRFGGAMRPNRTWM